MNTEIPNKYLIAYSNWFEFSGRILAFRKKILFDITENPMVIPFNENANCWIVNRKQLTKQMAQGLLIKEDKIVDVRDFQWYIQEQLNEVF